ncbi:unnamed protein product [Natator depressus]
MKNIITMQLLRAFWNLSNSTRIYLGRREKSWFKTWKDWKMVYKSSRQQLYRVAEIQAKALDTNLAALPTAFQRATAEKIRCQEEVNRTNKTIELADRLVKGLEVLEAKVNKVKINEAREHYRPVVARASQLYFRMEKLIKINPIYQFLLKWSKLEFTTDARKLHNVPLGQGQEAVAEIATVKASKEGHWVILQ